MPSYVELFDLRSANVMEHFADEQEAWDALRQLALEHGLEELNGLALSRSQDGQDTLIAMEDDLVRRVACDLHQADGDGTEPDPKSVERVAS